MRFVIDHGRCCVPELRPGEAIRVPREPLKPLVGFHYACPSCGARNSFVTPDLDAGCGLVVTEHSHRIVTVPPVACTTCRRAFHVAAGEVVMLPEDTALKDCGCVADPATVKIVALEVGAGLTDDASGPSVTASIKF